MSLVRYSLRASSPIWASEASLARTRFTRPNRRACSQARCVTIRLFVTVEPPIYCKSNCLLPSHSVVVSFSFTIRSRARAHPHK